MKPYKGTCKECENVRWITNSRELCDDCVYKKNHNGLSRFEVDKQRSDLKSKQKKKIGSGIAKSREDSKLKRKDVLSKDRQLYLLVFNSTEHICEECGIELPDTFEDEFGNIVMISQYSHIISKGSDGRFRWFTENVNRVCTNCHQIWEFGDRTKMKIYPINQKKMEYLRQGRRWTKDEEIDLF